MDTKEELMQIGERIRAYRRRRKLNQTELGKLIGYSMNGIAKIEQGNSDPKFSSLLKIADALGVSIKSLVTNEVTLIDFESPRGSEEENLFMDMVAEMQALLQRRHQEQDQASD